MKIWMLNHYATNQYFDGAGRHQSFAKYLIGDGHEVRIFCASTVHNSQKHIPMDGELMKSDMGKDDVPYTFVKTSAYQGNGFSRIRNMMQFYFRIFSVMKRQLEEDGAPDVILASSVHPLTLVAGIQFAKRIGRPCICEVRDLWPLSIVEYTSIKDSNPLIQLLYRLEHWIYKKADAVIFTWSNVKQYILEKQWEKDVNLEKLHYVNTGIDLELYHKNRKEHVLSDEDLDHPDLYKIVYAGSIRKANDVVLLVNAAEILQEEYPNVKFCVFGDGDQREPLMERCRERKIHNVVFKGHVEKEKIPAILDRADLLLVTLFDTNLAKYGVSWNKLFEYMASGKPMIANAEADIITDYQIGTARKFRDINDFTECIKSYIHMNQDQLQALAQRGKRAVELEFDSKNLSRKIVEIAEELQQNRG